MPTPSSRTSLPRVTAAATIQKAAEEKSPGTTTRPSSSRSAGSTVTRFAGKAPRMVTGVPASATSTRAPAARNMRSVWSRVGWASITPVTPSPSRPASSRHDFTWALATGRRYSTPRRADALTVSGGNRPSRASTPAPISDSGSAIRSTGRRRIDWSPSSDHSPEGWPASHPGISRSRVPAFPTSMAAGLAPRRPTPSIATSPPSASTCAPTASTAARVERVSSASR
jgi:hypothetical protein